MLERSLYPRMAAALLALLGIIDSAYLSISRLLPSSALVCVAGDGCQTVQQSIWSLLPPGSGIPVAYIGLGGYTLLFGVSMAALQTDRIGRLALPELLVLLASGGLLFSIYLTIVQIAVIGSLCFWCVLSALTQLGIWIATIIDWRAWRGQERSLATDSSTRRASRNARPPESPGMT